MLRRYSGVIESASGSAVASRTQSSEASNAVSSHLWASVQKESTSSTPSSRYRYSGHRAATPAQAASTCTQAPCSWAVVAMARTGSTAPVPVVPMVGQTSTGRSPAATSARSTVASASGDIATVPGCGVDDDQGPGAQAGDPHGLGQGGVGFGGDVDPFAAVDPVVAPPALELRCSAASRATSAAEDAESAMVPPPPAAKVNPGSRPSASARPSSRVCSTSVPAGEVDQSIPWLPSPPESRSPSSEARAALAGK